MAKERFNDRLKDELYQLAMGDKDIAESEFAGIYLTSKNPIKTKSHDFGKKIKFHLKRHFSISIDLEDCLDNKGYYSFQLPDYNFREDLLENEECKKAFLRGIYITSGRINELDKGNLVEISLIDRDIHELVDGLLKSFSLIFSQRVRKKRNILYIKKIDMISDFLSLISAPRSLLEFESARVISQVWNKTLRAVNFETANLEKVSQASRRQIGAISFLISKNKLESLPYNLYQTAKLRLDFPDSSLRELSMMANPAISKAGLAHRFNKIIEIAREYGYDK